MTRGQTVTVVVVGVASVVVPLVLVVLGLRAVLPSSDRARAAAQEAADRVAPGQVQVTSDTTAMLVGRRDVLASITAVVPVAELDGPARGRAAARLDACVRAWVDGRDGLLPVRSGTVRFELADDDGAVHSTSQGRVGGGQVEVSAGDRVSPVRDQDEYRDFVAAIDAPVRAHLEGQGITVRRLEDVRSCYAAGTTARLDLEVTVSQDSPDPVAPPPTRSLVLTVDADGRNPAGMRLVS